MSCTLPLFMGDVVVATDETWDFTVSATTPRTGTGTVPAGSWFASPIAALLWVYDQFRASVSYLASELTVSFNYSTGKLVLEGFDGNSGFTGLDFDAGPTINAALGLSGAVTGITAPYSPASAPEATWVPTWQVEQYTRSTRRMDGGSSRAFDGSTYSVRGVGVQVRNLAPVVDLRSGLGEWESWTGIWNSRWRAGRSVAVYLDRSDIQTATGDLGNGESLVLDSNSKLRPRRIDEYQDMLALVDGPYPFRVRNIRGGRLDYWVPS